MAYHFALSKNTKPTLSQSGERRSLQELRHFDCKQLAGLVIYLRGRRATGVLSLFRGRFGGEPVARVVDQKERERLDWIPLTLPPLL